MISLTGTPRRQACCVAISSLSSVRGGVVRTTALIMAALDAEEVLRIALARAGQCSGRAPAPPPGFGPTMFCR
jgi:hypothetical protein